MFEGKVGVDDLATDVAIVREVRAAIGPDATLTASTPTWRWDGGHCARGAAPHGPRTSCARSRTRPARSAEMARLRRRYDHLLLVARPRPGRRRAARGAGSVVRQPHVLGGIRRSIAFINACEELGVNVWFYSPDTGVMNAAYLQVAAAVEWVSRAQPDPAALAHGRRGRRRAVPAAQRRCCRGADGAGLRRRARPRRPPAGATSDSSPRGRTATTTTRRGPAVTGASSKESEP